MLGFSLVCALLGALVCADWQAIGNNDPCSFTNTSNTTISDFGCLTPLSCANNLTNTSTYEMLARECAAMSSASDDCFWNPSSRITGDFCSTCLPVCLSQQRSLDIYQFGVSALLFAFSASLGFVFLSAVMSDITPVDSQVCSYKFYSALQYVLISVNVNCLHFQGIMLSVLLGANLFSRGLSPYWCKLERLCL